MTTKLSGRRKHTKKVRFPGLDLVRSLFLVQLIIVVVIACFQEADPSDCSALWSSKSFIAFQPFLVLTGFLATYHLLSEKRRFGSFHILYYFMRRAITMVPVLLLLLLMAALHLFSFGMGCHTAGEFMAMVIPVTSAWHAALSGLPVDPVFFALVPFSLIVLFYLVWPVFIWLIPLRQHLWLEVSLITIALLFRAGLFTGELTLPWHPLSAVLPLMMGALLAQQVLVYPSSFVRFRSYRKLIRFLAVAGGIVSLVWYFAIAEDNHIRVLLELMLSLSAMLLIAIESGQYEETQTGKQPKISLLALPFTAGAVVGWDLSIHLIEAPASYIVLLLALASGALFAFIAIRFTFDRLMAWKEEFTFSAKK